MIHSNVIHKTFLQLEFYFNPKYVLNWTLVKPLLGSFTNGNEFMTLSTIAVEYYQCWGTRSSSIDMADIKLDERYILVLNEIENGYTHNITFERGNVTKKCRNQP